MRLTLAVLATAPLFLAQVGLLLLRFQDSWPHDSTVMIAFDELLNMPLFLAYCFLWTPWGVFYLLLCLFATLWAWGDGNATWKTGLLLGLVSTVTLLGIGYDIWWYATDQIFEMPA